MKGWVSGSTDPLSRSRCRAVKSRRNTGECLKQWVRSSSVHPDLPGAVPCRALLTEELTRSVGRVSQDGSAIWFSERKMFHRLCTLRGYEPDDSLESEDVGPLDEVDPKIAGNANMTSSKDMFQSSNITFGLQAILIMTTLAFSLA